MTHQGSPTSPVNDVLQPEIDAAVALANAATRAAAPTPLRRLCCYDPLPLLVRTGFVRRRGSRRPRPDGKSIGRCINSGDPDDDPG